MKTSRGMAGTNLVFKLCPDIPNFDTFSLIARQERIQSRGTGVDNEAQCGGCGAPIVQPNLSKDISNSMVQQSVSTIKGKGLGKNHLLAGSPPILSVEGSSSNLGGTKCLGKGNAVVTFMCKHVFHVECLSDEDGNVCNLCEGKRNNFTRL